MAYSPDGKLIASGGADGTVILWDAGAVTSTAIHEAYAAPPAHLAAAAKRAASHIVRRLHSQTVAVRHLAFSPVKDPRLNSWILAGSAEDHVVRLWAIDRGELTQTIRGHQSLVVTAAFSPDGRLLATGSRGPAPDLRIWDVATGDLLRLLDLREWVTAVAFSPDGRLLASGRADGIVQLLDVAALLQREPEDPAGLSILGRHDGGIETVHFSPDGRTMATGGSDRMVRLWDVPSRRLDLTLAGHGGWVMSVAFSPDGEKVSQRQLGPERAFVVCADRSAVAYTTRWSQRCDLRRLCARWRTSGLHHHRRHDSRLGCGTRQRYAEAARA